MLFRKLSWYPLTVMNFKVWYTVFPIHLSSVLSQFDCKTETQMYVHDIIENILNRLCSVTSKSIIVCSVFTGQLKINWLQDGKLHTSEIICRLWQVEFRACFIHTVMQTFFLARSFCWKPCKAVYISNQIGFCGAKLVLAFACYYTVLATYTSTVSHFHKAQLWHKAFVLCTAHCALHHNCALSVP